MPSRKSLWCALIVVVMTSAACGNRLAQSELREAAGLTAAAGVSPGAANAGSEAQAATGAPGEAGYDVAAPSPSASGGNVSSSPGPSSAPAASGGARGAATAASGGSAATPGTGPAAAAPGRAEAAGTPSGPASPGASESPGQANQGAGGSCAPNCAPIVVATVGTYSGIVGQNIGGGVKALQAWVGVVNAKGGLNGHLVQLFVADDGGDPARHRALVQQMVEERHAIAFLFNAEVLSGAGSVDYINRVRVPVIGSEGGGTWFHESPLYFPQHSSGQDLPLTPVGSAAESMIPQGKKNLGLIVCADGIQVCEDAKKTVPERAPKWGFNFVYSGSASLAQPDLTSHCLAARDAGVELLFILMDKNSISRTARSCANIGYKPIFLLNQTIENDALATDPNLDGAVGSGVVAPWFDTSNPSVVEFREAMARFAPGVDISGAPMQGWASAKLFEKAAGAIGNPPTSEQVLQGLWSMKNETLGGITPPLTFTKDQTAAHYVCYWAWLVKDKKFVSVGDGQVRCR